MRNPSDEDFLWRAHYIMPDGVEPSPELPAYLDEYEGEASDPPEKQVDHAFAHIDLARCYAIELLPQRPHLSTHIVKVDPTKRQRVIFFRRRIVPVLLVDDGQGVTRQEPNGKRETITVLGWQKNVGSRGTNVKAFTHYFPDGTSAVTDTDAL